MTTSTLASVLAPSTTTYSKSVRVWERTLCIVFSRPAALLRLMVMMDSTMGRFEISYKDSNNSVSMSRATLRVNAAVAAGLRWTETTKLAVSRQTGSSR